MEPADTQHPLWHWLLTHYKEKACLVEGPLTNLQTSMIQFAKPKKSLTMAMEPFRPRNTSAAEYLDKGECEGVPSLSQ